MAETGVSVKAVFLRTKHAFDGTLFAIEQKICVSRAWYKLFLTLQLLLFASMST